MKEKENAESVENMTLFEKLFKGLKDVITMPIRKQAIKGKLFTALKDVESKQDTARNELIKLYTKIVEDEADATIFNKCIELKATIDGATNTIKYIKEIHTDLFNEDMKTEL